MKRKFGIAALVTILGILMAVGVAYALNITVDGIKESAWDGGGSQTPGTITDVDEAGIDNRWDIKAISYTNDALGVAPWGHLYFLFESYDNFDSVYPVATPQIIVCLDVDNNTGTGTTASGYCNDMAGIDRRIYFYPSLGTVLVQRWNGSAFVTVPQPSGGMRAVAYNDPDADGIANLPYIEGGIDLQSLGITNTATCITSMPMAVYYDNGIVDGEDQVPDSGTTSISCGGPTAITLSSVKATSVDNSAPIAAVGVVSFAIVVTVIAFVLRRRQIKQVRS